MLVKEEIKKTIHDMRKTSDEFVRDHAQSANGLNRLLAHMMSTTLETLDGMLDEIDRHEQLTQSQKH